MKRILAFRCAAEDVMEKLFTRIGDREDITCYVQENAVREYGSKYPHVKFLSIHENYFNYDSFLKSADIVQEKFDRIYIPSTSRNFNGFDEIFKIVGLMKYRELVLFNCDGWEKSEFHTPGARVRESIQSGIAAFYGRYVDRHFQGRYRKL